MGEPFAECFEPAGLISLTTDFGLTDGYVGVMHAVAYGVSSSLSVVDLVHTVAAQDLLEASFHVRSAWEHFPKGSVHVIVVDPGVGTARRSLVAHAMGQLFVAPDNGVLPAIFAGRHVKAATYGALDAENQMAASASRTFHGRDLYAPVGARLASGILRPADAIACSITPDEVVQIPGAAPDFEPGRAAGAVVHIDRFGNAISSLDVRDGRVQRLLESAAVVDVGGRRLPIVGTYGEARSGDLVALVDSFGLLEVAQVGGDAAAELDLRTGDRVTLLEDPDS